MFCGNLFFFFFSFIYMPLIPMIFLSFLMVDERTSITAIKRKELNVSPDLKIKMMRLEPGYT